MRDTAVQSLAHHLYLRCDSREQATTALKLTFALDPLIWVNSRRRE
jgi:hypothetical protein